MNEEEGFKKKFEEANPGIKVTTRTKKKNYSFSQTFKVCTCRYGVNDFYGGIIRSSNLGFVTSGSFYRSSWILWSSRFKIS